MIDTLTDAPQECAVFTPGK